MTTRGTTKVIFSHVLLAQISITFVGPVSYSIITGIRAGAPSGISSVSEIVCSSSNKIGAAACVGGETAAVVIIDQLDTSVGHLNCCWFIGCGSGSNCKYATTNLKTIGAHIEFSCCNLNQNSVYCDIDAVAEIRDQRSSCRRRTLYDSNTRDFGYRLSVLESEVSVSFADKVGLRQQSPRGSG